MKLRPGGFLLPGAAAVASVSRETVVAEDGDVLIAPRDPTVPPRGYVHSPAEVIRIAAAVPSVSRETAAAERRPYGRAYLAGKGRWQVSFYVPPPSGKTRSREIAQVVIDDRGGRVREAWTGPQVAWPMARGAPGQFGRAVNSPWIWIGLCMLFVAPFLGRPLRLIQLDLAVLLAFSIPYAMFGATNVSGSVPLVYPLLAYLLARALHMAFRGRRDGPRLVVSDDFLLVGLVFLIGFRLALNVVDGNVIDVGYAGVIGGDRLLHGEALYGGFPADNLHGDTYGPVAYIADVPFVALFGWSGTWDDLPAAHAAALAFDIACIAGLWVAGRRLGGRSLGLLLAYLWVACPFTLLAANSSSNDTLVAALVLGAFLCMGRPAFRGSLIVLAGMTKFAPFALVPLIVRSGPRRARSAVAAGLVAAALVTGLALGPGLHRFWDQTVGYQAGRDSPFSIWGLYDGLGGLHAVVAAGTCALAIAVAYVPRPRDEATVAALGAAVLIAVQLTLGHWFYLYLVWFLPLLLIGLLAPGRVQSSSGRRTGSIDSARPSEPQRITTALIHGSSSAGS
jgi:hypothetical protein